ncbi:hypothetical protein [Spirosoma flavus]
MNLTIYTHLLKQKKSPAAQTDGDRHCNIMNYKLPFSLVEKNR